MSCSSHPSREKTVGKDKKCMIILYTKTDKIFMKVSMDITFQEILVG